MRTSHWISAIIGALLSLATLTELVHASYGFYQEFCLFPMEKYGVPDPLRWEDIVFLVVFYFTAAALLYVSYRLLKSAYRNTNSETDR